MVLDNSSSSSKCLFLLIYPIQQEQLPYVVLSCVFNALLFIPNVLGSALIIVTMWKNPNLDMPSHIYLSSLAFADLITGFIVQPMFVLHKVAWMYGNVKVDCVARVVTELIAWISSAVTCTIIAIITIDRMLALKLHLKYQFYVTRKRAFRLTVWIWLSLTVLSFTRFGLVDIKIFVAIGACGIFLSILQVFIAYAQIYKYMRHHQKKIAIQVIPAQLDLSSTSDGGVTHEIKGVKVRALWKSAMNLAYVAVLYVIVYLPFACTLIAILVYGQTVAIDILYDVTRTFLFCASVFNPLVYCWKIKDIKVEVVKTLNKLRNNSVATFTNTDSDSTVVHGRKLTNTTEINRD